MLAQSIHSTPTGYDILDAMIEAIPSYYLLAMVLIASCLILVRLRHLLDLCGRNLGDARVLDGPDHNPRHTFRPGTNQQHSTTIKRMVNSGGRGHQHPTVHVSESGPIDRRHRGSQFQKSLPFRPRLPDAHQNRALPTASRRAPETKPSRQKNAHVQPTRSLDWLAHLPETHRLEAQHLYRSLPNSVARQLIERTNEGGHSEMSRQYPRLPAVNGGEGELLDSWREIGNMADDWDDLTRWEAGDGGGDGDAESEQESDEEFMGSIARDLKTLSLDLAKHIVGANVQHGLRRACLRGGGNGLDARAPRPNSNTTSGSGGEEEEEIFGLGIEDLSDPSDIFDYDTLLGLSRYPSEARPPLLASVSGVDLQQDLRRGFGGPSPLTVRQDEVIEDADPSVHLSPINEVGGGSSFNTSRSAVLFSREVSEEYDDMLHDLDATYQHIDMARRKLLELVHRAGRTEGPLLRQIIVSNNELQARQMELAKLKTYERNLRNSVQAPNRELVDELLGFIEEGELSQRFDEDWEFADDESDDYQHILTLPQRPWGWRPKPKATRPRNRSWGVSHRGIGKVRSRGRPHNASGLSGPAQVSSSTSFENAQPGQMLGNQRPTTSMGEGSSSSSAREFQQVTSQNHDGTYVNHIASHDRASQQGPASSHFAWARSHYWRPQNRIGRLSPVQEIEEIELRWREASRQPRYCRRGLSHRSANGMKSGMKRPGYSRPKPPLRDSSSTTRARRVPTSRATLWRNLYPINGRMADELAGRRRTLKRSGGGGPWPWPGPGGPIPDPVPPPYA